MPIDPQLIGAIGLVLAGAAAVGVGVYRLLAPRAFAYELALIATFATVAGLAYAGVQAAAAVMWVCLIVLGVVWAIAALANS